MNRVTQEFKQAILQRGFQPPASLNSAFQSNQQRFLHHFESINPTNSQVSPTPILYAQKIEQYHSEISIVDKILLQNEDAIAMQCPPVLVHHPLLPIPSLSKSIASINRFFEGQPQSYLNIDLSQDILELDSYSRLVSSFGRVPQFIKELDPKMRPKLQSKPQHEPQMEIKLNQGQSERYQTTSTTVAGLKKSDVILMQILREKKRKGTERDYFGSMQLRLMQLLQYILQDEEDFRGLDSTEKMKQVLRRLEYFKGKQIQGQSKINLLRIFFEQFRNLKQEKQQIILNNPPQIENRWEPPTDRPKNRKNVKKVSQSQNNLSQTSKQRRKSGAPSSKQDQWMGELL